MANLKSTHVAALSTGSVAKELLARGTLGDIDERQLRRYAAVAQKLAQSDDCYECVKTFCKLSPGIGLVHLKSQTLLSFTDASFWQLAMASLNSLLFNGVKGSFEVMHAPFYKCVKLLFDCIRNTAGHKKTSLHTLLDANLNITAHNQKAVFHYIADTMGRYTLVANQGAADNTRLKNLKRKLIQLLGEDIEPTSSKSDGLKRPATRDSADEGDRAAFIVSDLQTGTQNRTVVNPSGLNDDGNNDVGGPRRSARKRNVVQEMDGANADTIPKKRASKKYKAKQADHIEGRATYPRGGAIALTENIVSNFLRHLQPKDLTRIISALGVEVVPARTPPMFKNVPVQSNFSTGDTPIQVLPTFYDSFDDSLPSTLPEVWANPPPFSGSPLPSWMRFATKIPSKWPKKNPIQHVSPWLASLHIPQEHRAHSVVSNINLLLQKHHTVYYRAAHAFHSQRPTSALPQLPRRFGSNLTTQKKLWSAAVEEDDFALEFFGAKKQQLSTDGFCILETFLNDDDIPEQVGNFRFPKVTCPQPFFKSLETEASVSFPGEQFLSDPGNRTTWNIMQNVSGTVDSNAVFQGQGRFRMTNYGILERLEKDSDTLWTITGRALLDIRVGQCLASLKVAQSPGSKPLSCLELVGDGS